MATVKPVTSDHRGLILASEPKKTALYYITGPEKDPESLQ